MDTRGHQPHLGNCCAHIEAHLKTRTKHQLVQSQGSSLSTKPIFFWLQVHLKETHWSQLELCLLNTKILFTPADEGEGANPPEVKNDRTVPGSGQHCSAGLSGDPYEKLYDPALASPPCKEQSWTEVHCTYIPPSTGQNRSLQLKNIQCVHVFMSEHLVGWTCM